ncbi:hypothetical protein PL78_18830 [Yersinia entomophaga]|uniref:Uncharacterized protein n=1 Tax=Yersinia entomophaga TaxID=935293 RepID=A0ABN4Q430_YERET|nr:hypothetical protein PL78_18830 [Yersinia entomophaga]OWF86735.1 hypothetical protein B4914_14250 [Yersinia entomophaga]
MVRSHREYGLHNLFTLDAVPIIAIIPITKLRLTPNGLFDACRNGNLYCAYFEQKKIRMYVFVLIKAGDLKSVGVKSLLIICCVTVR